MIELNQLEEIERTTIGIHDAYGTIYEAIGFINLLTRSQARSYLAKLVREIVLARIARPASINFLAEKFGTTLDLDHVYQMMDKIDDAFCDRIQQRALAMTLKLTGEKLRVLFYDVTTLYFDSFNEYSFKQTGYRKDMTFNQAQVVFALFVTEKGLSVGYELFPGSTTESTILL